MLKISLFLGAGASKPFGYPTTEDFMNNIRTKLRGDQRILFDTIIGGDDVKDIEHVLEFLDVATTFYNNQYVKSVFSKYALTASLVKGSLVFSRLIEVSNGLKRRIEREVFIEYETDPAKNDEIKNHYDELFETLGSYMNLKEMDVFTTNYDRVIEQLCISYNGIYLIDGFTYNSNTRYKYWNHEEEYSKQIKYDDLKLLIKLYKLHGSLDWRINQNDEIINVDTEEHFTNSRRYKSNLVIYPGQKANESEPFRTILNYFNNRINNINVIIVIGFSFRDPKINEIFVKFLNDDNNHLIVLSPNSEENIISNFLPDLTNLSKKKLDAQILPITEGFGSHESINLLYGKLQLIQERLID